MKKVDDGMAGRVETELTIEEVKELSDRLQSGYDEKGVDNPDMMQIITTLKNVGKKMEEQEKGWNFLHEPIRMMIDLLNEVYPNHKANIMFAEYEHPEGEESLALTNFPEDGSTPDILIKEVDANIPQVLDLIAHEAAHVIAGAEAEHGPEWEKVYEDIFNAYQHRNEVL